MRVLVVDDEELVRNAMVRALRHLGHEALAVADGTEAVAQAPQFHPDLCLVDLLMPYLDGIQTIAQLAEVLPHLPCVLLTGTPEAAVGRTNSPVFAKPIGLHELKGILDRIEQEMTTQA